MESRHALVAVKIVRDFIQVRLLHLMLLMQSQQLFIIKRKLLDYAAV